MTTAPASDLGACERCGGEHWTTQRPGLVDGTARWLRSGGPWRPSRQVCERCGAPGPSVAWLVRWDDDRPLLTLPVRLARDLSRTLAGERTAVPAPWLYLASAAGGAAVGVGAALLSGSGRPLLATAVGAPSGALVCWSVFAATALRRPSTWFELRAAALQQVSPRRATALRAARSDAVARGGSFPAYGLERWDGPRLLLGQASEGRPPRLTSLSLGHALPSFPAGPWVVVETAEADHGEQHREALLADALLDEASARPDVDLAGLDDAALLAHLRDVRRARDARPEPQWHDRALLVHGRQVPVRWAGEGGHWVAHLRLPDRSVALRAHDVPLEDVALVAVEDLDAYASWSG